MAIPGFQTAVSNLGTMLRMPIPVGTSIIPRLTPLSEQGWFAEPDQVAQRQQWEAEATAQGYDWLTDPRYQPESPLYQAPTPIETFATPEAEQSAAVGNVVSRIKPPAFEGSVGIADPFVRAVDEQIQDSSQYRTLSIANVLKAIKEPEVRSSFLQMYQDDVAAGDSVGTAYQNLVARTKDHLSGNAMAVGPLSQDLRPTRPADWLAASGGTFELAGQGLRTLAEPATSRLPQPIRSPVERGIELAPAFAAGPGSLVQKAGYLGAAVLGGETTEALGVGRGVGELVAPFAAPAAASAARRGIQAATAGIKSTDISAWEKTLEVLQKGGREALPEGAPTKTLGQVRQQTQDLMEAALQRPLNADELASLRKATAGKLTQIQNQIAAAHGFTQPGGTKRIKLGITGDDLPQVDPAVAGKNASAAAQKAVGELGTAAPAKTLPLGVRGGGTLERNLNGIDLTDESRAVVRQFSDDLAGVSERIKPAGRVRGITSKIAGDLDDPYLSEVVFRERQLRDAIATTELKAIPKLNINGLDDVAKAQTINDLEQWIASAQSKVDDAAKAFRENALKTRYTNKAALKTAMGTYAANEAAFQAQTRNIFDKAQGVLKELRFGFDLGTTLQQDLKALRAGGITTIPSAAMGKTVDRIRQALGTDPVKLGVYTNPAISHEAERASAGLITGGAKAVGLERDILQSAAKSAATQSFGARAAALPGAFVKGLTDLQYGALSKLRTTMYEGRMYQMKMLGFDISNSQLKQDIADWANMATSTARGATDATRALWERRLLLTPQMTRSQFAEIAQPIRSVLAPNSARLLNTVNQLSSTMATMGLIYGINDVIGSPLSPDRFAETVANPISPTFGRITTKWRDASGARIVVDLLPQLSLERAVLKSLADTKKLAEGDQDAAEAFTSIMDNFAKYGFGRLNVIPQMAGRTAGLGYDENGKFHYGDLTVEDRLPTKDLSADARLFANTFLPLSVAQTLTTGDVKTVPQNPAGAILSFLGANQFGEATWGAEDRIAQQEFGQGYWDLDVLGQAKVHLQMREEGEKVDDKSLAGPYWGATRTVFERIKDKNPEALGQFEDLDAFRTEVESRIRAKNPDLKTQEVEAIYQKIADSLGITEAAKALRIGLVKTDPEIARALQRLYDSGDSLYPPPTYILELLEGAK